MKSQLANHFYEVAGEINKRFNSLPLLFSSFGLSLAINKDLDPTDIDILLSDILVTKKLFEVDEMMLNLGYELKNRSENEYVKSGIIIGFGREGSLKELKDLGIDIEELKTVKNDLCEFLVLEPKEYLIVYEKFLEDGYRNKKKGRKDMEKVGLIKKVLEGKI